tara:strand:- start:4454 stop:4660 length:207 start_codon:yes stop_codon:yes gene_type:complete
MGKTKDAQANPCQLIIITIIVINGHKASENANFLPGRVGCLNKKLHFAIVYQQTFYFEGPIIQLSNFE